MKFETPATTNPIDQLKIVGKPVDRIDGRLKTTGTAPYAYERHDAAANPAYGYVVGAAIAKGRIASIDLDRAKAAPGVLAIVTAENAGKLDKGNLNTARLLGGFHAEIVQFRLPHRRLSWRHRTSISFAPHRHHHIDRALPSYMKVIGLGPGI
jgi:hypothetical protein